MITPLVSIAVCTYNGEKFLRTQLDSLVCQDYNNIEIIVSDDCSSDKTIEILKSYQKRYPFFRYVCNEQNLGYIKNFERVVLLCRGEYIALSDQDDIWDIDKISLQVAEIGDAALIYHDSAFINEKGEDMNKSLSDLMRLYQGDSPYPFILSNCVSGHSIMFARKLLPKVIPFDANFFHDKWIAFVATLNGGIKLIPKTLVKYRQHSSSETDILRLKAVKKKSAKSVYFTPGTIDWIRKCSFKTSKYSDFFTEFISCFDQNYHLVKRFKMFKLLVNKTDEIFATNNKSTISRINLLRKICFHKN